MAKTVSITKDLLRKSAFEMAREQGVNEVTARKLAAYAGCSTQPIFRNYANMEDCLNDVYEDTLLYFDDFYNKYDKGSHIPFVNLGMAYISFAEKEPKLFSFLFMTRNTHGMNLYNILNGRTGAVMKEMNAASDEGVRFPEQIFMKMWMLIHGAACMTITGDYDLTSAQTRLQLEDAYKSFTR
ncbi:MAG: WHG domain-containing protein [Lachnospiraceae bacterium]|jgi:AcrR family transcriptional regulator|nr:WHG domain-containing protein [Lachnospiraceae bacterium]